MVSYHIMNKGIFKGNSHYSSSHLRRKGRWMETVKTGLEGLAIFSRITHELQTEATDAEVRGGHGWAFLLSNAIPALLFSRLTRVTCCEAQRCTLMHKHRAEGGSGGARLERIKGIFAWRKSNRKNSKFIGSCRGLRD